VAELAGPLRAAAATMLSLEGKPAPSPRDALERVATELAGAGAAPALRALSRARETGELEPGVVRATALILLDLAAAMHARAAKLA
jgi:hypothetical protein